jgi:hypothetical protein
MSCWKSWVAHLFARKYTPESDGAVSGVEPVGTSLKRAGSCFALGSGVLRYKHNLPVSSCIFHAVIE